MKKIAASKYAIAVAGLMATSIAAHGEIIFQDDFNSQPDWTSTMHSTNAKQIAKNGDILPQGWSSIFQDSQWSPELGFPNKHASLEILGSNSDKCMGQTGKCAVEWRDSYSLGWHNWASDSQLVKYFGKQYKQLYVQFYIRFAPDFYGRDHTGPWQSKIFRVGSWNGTGDRYNGALGALGPIAFWDYKHDDYGVRNVIAFRGGPWGQNYMNLQYDYKMGGSLNFNTDLKGQGADGGNSKLQDQVNGGYLADYKGVVSHNQVFGQGATWTKMAFFVRMNSAPGKQDGIFMEWVDGHRVVDMENIPWILPNTGNQMVGWNYFAIGGNDYFQPYPNSQQYQDWYAIDNVTVRNDLPPELSGEIGNPPNAPSKVSVQ